MQDDERQYHSVFGFVQTGPWMLELAAIWDGIESAEAANISLSQIGHALSRSWSDAVVALARKDFIMLRALIEGAAS